MRTLNSMLACVLLALPFTISAQRLELIDTTYSPFAGLFITDMELVSPTECIMTGYAGNSAPWDPAPGFIASVYMDSCDWAQGLFVKWSRTLSDTTHVHLGDTTYMRLDGTVRGCTVLEGGAVLAFGSAGGSDRAAMVALLGADGDTLWTTSVSSLPGEAWFTDGQQAPDGSIYCVGSMRDTLGFTDQLIARFSATGDLLWYRTVELPGTNDAARQCSVQGDTLLVFSAVGDVAGTDTINETDIGLLRVSSAGELLDGRVLGIPDDFGYGEVVSDMNGGFFLCTGVYSDNQVFNAADCGLIHLGPDLDTIGTPMRVVGLNDVDDGVAAGLAFDPLSGNVFIGGTGMTGVGTFGTFTVAISVAQAEALWGRLVEDGHFLFGGIELTDAGTRVRTMCGQLGSGSTYVNSWDAATGSLGSADECALYTWTWTPAVTALEVDLIDEGTVLSAPAVQAWNELEFGGQDWDVDVCPGPPSPDACSVAVQHEEEASQALIWPNPVAPGSLVRFGEHATVYDALGKTIRVNVTQMAAPEMPGCYVVGTGERRMVLVVQE